MQEIIVLGILIICVIFIVRRIMRFRQRVKDDKNPCCSCSSTDCSLNRVITKAKADSDCCKKGS